MINSTFKIYPNPTTDYLNITDIDGGKDINVRIYNMIGSKIIDVKMNKVDVKSAVKVNVSNLVSGMYIMTIENSTGFRSAKFIKK